MSSTIAPVEERASYGIGVLLSSQIFFLFLDPSAKLLAIAGIPTGEIVFMRYFVHVLLLLVIFLPMQGAAIFVTANWRLEVLRGLALLGSTVFNFLAVKFLPLTITSALMFTMPLIVCALSVPLLGEVVGWRRWLAIGAGFVGILVVTRPGTESFHPAALLSLLGACFLALYSIITRKLAGVDSTATQQFYAGIVALACVAPFAADGWVWPDEGVTWFAFVAMGTVGMLGHQFVTIAHRFASPAVLAPFNYLQILYMAVISWLVFNQPPDVWFYLGAPIIVLSGLYVWLRERRLARQAIPLTVAD